MKGPEDSTAGWDRTDLSGAVSRGYASLCSMRKGNGMWRWMAAICLCPAVVVGWAQDDEAARANALYQAGKRPDALPLYEDLTRANPNEKLYFERLADCLGAEAVPVSNRAQVKAIRIRERDAAKRAG